MQKFILVLLVSLAIAQDPKTLRNDRATESEWIRHEVQAGRAPLIGWGNENQLPVQGRLKVVQGLDTLVFHPLLGLEWRSLQSRDDLTKAVDGGIEVVGHKGGAKVFLDARIFTELHSRSKAYSYDREFIESQKEGDLSNFSFSSYARYRAGISYSGSLGTLGARRDVLQWGPGVFHNLVFNSQSVPFAHAYYQGEVGPVRIMGLVGELSIDGVGSFRSTSDSRTVYAHRYEWNISPNWLFGVSEQMIVYNEVAPAAIIPIVPLFMEKGQGLESSNNGNIAFDLSMRLPKGLPVGGMIYGEFFVDDLQEPSSLFDNFWGNRWAGMWGFDIAKDWGTLQIGAIQEFVHIEPWVYTHYLEKTVQATHRGYPLGERLGPNSKAFTSKLYVRNGFAWTTGLRMDWIWKGTDPGSQPEDAVRVYKPTTKVFLQGVNHPVLWIGPTGTYTWRCITLDLEGRLQSTRNQDWVARVLYKF
jgi:hypothetical protein